jgi:signal peptidase II
LRVCPSMKRKYWFFLFIFFFILSVDQWTKYVIQQKLPLYLRLRVIHGFFNLTHVRNAGGAFGIFGGERGGLGSLIFVAVSLIAIGILLLLLVKMKEEKEIICLSFPLILAGAIGNLIDRLRYGEVIDFLDFHLFSHHWPAFNMADSAITAGVILLGYGLLIQGKKNRSLTLNSK